MVVLLCACVCRGQVHAQSQSANDNLLAAAKTGDAAALELLLTSGADVNARTAYGVTALHLAADKGHLEVVQVLLRHKADINLKDTFYGSSALTWAADKRHTPIVAALLEAGADGADAVLLSAAARGNAELTRHVLGKASVKPETLSRALIVAKDRPEIAKLLEEAGAKATAISAIELAPEVLAAYTGTYRNDDAVELTVTAADSKLALMLDDRRLGSFAPTGQDSFGDVADPSRSLKFQRENERTKSFAMTRGTTSVTYVRIERRDAPATTRPASDDPAGPIIARNWPSFRGPNASGIADDQWPPAEWNLQTGQNVRWKTPIPGLGHSCPIVWDDRVYITTAVRADGKADLKVGLYGNVDSVSDTSEHAWKVYSLDKGTGRILWEQVAHQGVPRIKRHTKATHANSTPVTDGQHVVANFGSEGLYCYDRDGKLLWHRDLGTLDSGWFFDADYQWGFGSSPIIYQGLVIVQCDVGRGSFIAAYRVSDGEEVWRTPREEIPSWGTPTIVEGPQRVELVTNATKFARGYDPLTGTELWRLARQSEITVPTPIFGENLIFVCSGYRPVQPISAIRPGSHGDISLEGGKTASEFIAWSTSKGGSYMTTPVVYRGHFYVCDNMGIVTCYDAQTGQQVYKQRLPGKGAFTASPVAADGKIYFTAEDGGVRVIKAGPEFVVLAENALGESCLATPAVSDGMIFFRTESHVFAIGRTAAP
jgi:outer membrane protein assembly factor BamB